MDFKDWLHKTRKEKDMTLEEVAGYAGTSKSYYWEIENGRSIPSLEKAEDITQALGYKLSTALRQCGK